MSFVQNRSVADVFPELQQNAQIEGKGIASTVAKKAFRFAANKLRKGKPGVRQLREGELHYRDANFEGPGTRLDLAEVRNAKPVNPPDEISRTHDFDYQEALDLLKEGKISEKESKAMIRVADLKFIKDMRALPDGQPWDDYKKAGLLGIETKVRGEQLSPKLAKFLLGSIVGGRIDAINIV